MLAAASYAGEAAAWAWPMEDGQTQAILKYEAETADEAFDPDGLIAPIGEQEEESLSLFLEYGLTDRVTLQGKLGWTQGSTPFAEYAGRGPIEFGARYTFFRSRRTVATVYGGAVLAGEGRNAGYAAPGAGGVDLEMRLLGGRSGTLWKRFHLFGEAQVARIVRDGLPDETRIETTIGVEPARRWLLLAQNYAGRADGEDIQPLWLKSEVSVIRDLADWRLQAGWRWTSLGVEMPVHRGPVLALWRRF